LVRFILVTSSSCEVGLAPLPGQNGTSDLGCCFCQVFDLTDAPRPLDFPMHRNSRC